MLTIGQVNEFTPFTETGNLRLFPPPMMQIVQYGQILLNGGISTAKITTNIFRNHIQSHSFISR